MSVRLEITSAAGRRWPLQCWNEGALSTPVFGPTDVLSATVSPGEGQPALFAPTVIWWTNPVGGDPSLPTQTGYDQGQVLLTVDSTMSPLLDPLVEYPTQIWLQAGGTGEKYCIWSGVMVAEWSVGLGRPSVPVYCTFQDMVDFGPWCRYVQDVAAMKAGFYDQRLEARIWLDDLINRSYRASALYPFGTAAVPWPYWSGWEGPWRSAMPSIWIKDQLWGGTVATPVSLSAGGTGYTAPPTVTAPPPTPSTLDFIGPRQKQARFLATLDGSGHVGAILVPDVGFGYVPGQSIPLVFSGGGGTGAAATAQITAGALMQRDQVRRIAAYKALSIVGLSQIGVNPQHTAFGEYFAAKASEELTGYVAEIDVNYDGLPNVAIPTYVVNTIYQ